MGLSYPNPVGSIVGAEFPAFRGILPMGDIVGVESFVQHDDADLDIWNGGHIEVGVCFELGLGCDV
jgi:hypothetical protein